MARPTSVCARAGTVGLWRTVGSMPSNIRQIPSRAAGIDRMPNDTWWSRWGSVVAMLVSVLMTVLAGTIWVVSEVRVLQADMMEVKRKLEQVEVVGRILDRYVADLLEHSDAARRPH